MSSASNGAAPPALTYVRTYVRYPSRMNATKLRADLYTVLDQVLKTGTPVLIERKGQRLKLSVDDTPPSTGREKLAWPSSRPGWVNGSVDDLVHLDWSSEWRP